MGFENLNYYGYSRRTYTNCLDQIRETDLKHARILNVWFTILCVVIFFLSGLEDFTLLAGNPTVYFIYFVLAFVWDIFVFFFRKWTTWTIRLVVMINILFLMSFSIYSSVVQPYMSADIFPVMIVVVAFSYIITFFSMSLILISGGVLFLWTSFIFKPASVIYVDVYNLVLFLTLAFVLHYTFQKMKISRFVTYYENERIQRDLEVRSSYDALTGLLNRGRFFSMASEIVRSHHDDYMVLCLFDLDGFKEINDKLGHQMGDKAIQIAAENLVKGFQIDFGEKWDFEKRAMNEKLSFAGRLGGDEFVVFLRGRAGKEEVMRETQELLDALSKVRAGELEGIYSSVGIARMSSSDHDIDVAYTCADEALYASKAAGKHTITFGGEEKDDEKEG